MKGGAITIQCETFEWSKDNVLIFKKARIIKFLHYKADALLNYSNVSDGSIEITDFKYFNSVSEEEALTIDKYCETSAN